MRSPVVHSRRLVSCHCSGIGGEEVRHKVQTTYTSPKVVSRRMSGLSGQNHPKFSNFQEKGKKGGRHSPTWFRTHPGASAGRR